MDWTQALTIIFTVFGMLLAFVIYLMSRMDNKFANVDNKFEQLLNRIDQKIDHLEQKMDSKFDAVNTRFNALENRLTSLESDSKNMSQRITDLKTDMNQRLSNIESCVMPRKVFHFEESHHKEDHDEPKEN